MYIYVYVSISKGWVTFNRRGGDPIRSLTCLSGDLNKHPTALPQKKKP